MMTKIDEAPAPAIPGVLRAGGLARRMGGGDKPMRQIGGRPILARVIAWLAPQCDGHFLLRQFMPVVMGPSVRRDDSEPLGCVDAAYRMIAKRWAG
jgi:CTP:molybdopterin cytidylyltransferase MocA